VKEIDRLIEELRAEIRELAASLPEPAAPNNQKKLNLREVSRMREMHRIGYSQAELASIYDVNPATVSRIVRGVYHR
jgi:hypothetical protein